MAEDINKNTDEASRALDDFTRVLRQSINEIERHGTVSAHTTEQATELADGTEAAAKATRNSEAKMRSLAAAGNILGNVFNNLISIGASAAQKTLDGAKGASVLNDEMEKLIDTVTMAGQALSLLLPGGIFVKAITFAAATLFGTMAKVDNRLNNAARKMSDELYDTYRDMAKGGAAAGDGLSGLFDDANKLGLSMKEIGTLTRVVTESAGDFALLTGSVAQGRKQLAGMGESLKYNREEFLRLGMNMEDVTEGLGSYMRIQKTLGTGQKRSVEEMAVAAKQYIYETDMLARITGKNRREQEAMAESAMTQEQYAGVINKLRLEGNEDAIKRMQELNVMMSTVGPAAQQGVRAMFAGNIMDEEAQKLTRTFSAVGIDIEGAAQKVKEGSMTQDEFMRIFDKGAREFQEKIGNNVALVGQSNKNYMSQQEVGRVIARKGAMTFEEARKQEEAEREKQKAATDQQLKDQAAIRNAQLEANKALERFASKSIPDANKAMLTLVTSTEYVAKEIERLFGKKISTPKAAPSTAEAKKTAEEKTKVAQDLYEKAQAPDATEEDKEKYEKAQSEAGQAGMQVHRSSQIENAQISKKLREMQREENKKKDGKKVTREDARAALGLPAPGKSKSALPSAAKASGAAPGAPGAPGAPATPGAAPSPGAAGAAPAAPAAPAAETPAKAGTPASSISSRGVDLVAQFEGFTPKAMWDHKQWSIGYGTATKDPDEISGKKTIDKSEANSRLSSWLSKITPDVIAAGREKQWGQNQVDAMASFAYNLGVGALSQVTNNGKRTNQEIADAMLLYNKASGETLPGLVRRRESERALFVTDMPMLAEGGIASMPSIVGEAGPEAVIPLKNESVPVEITTDSTVGQTLVSLNSLMQQLLEMNAASVGLLQSIERTNSNTAAATEKTARYASN